MQWRPMVKRRFVGDFMASKPKAPRQDDYPPSQATKRRDDALRAALSMPPRPFSPAAKEPKKTTRPRKSAQ